MIVSYVILILACGVCGFYVQQAIRGSISLHRTWVEATCENRVGTAKAKAETACVLRTLRHLLDRLERGVEGTRGHGTLAGDYEAQ